MKSDIQPDLGNSQGGGHTGFVEVTDYRVGLAE
jgi:hypothetical protein